MSAVRLQYRDGFTTLVVPLFGGVMGAVALADAAWWAVPVCAALIAAGWWAAAQRLVIADGAVFVSHLPFGSAGVRLALADVRVRTGAAWLTIERLDGERVTRSRRIVRFRVFPISGPPVIVHELRAMGAHVTR